MDESTARRLVALNNDFYRQAVGTFTITRQHAWPGWEGVLDCLRNDLPGACAGRFREHGDEPPSPMSQGENPALAQTMPPCSQAVAASETLHVLDLACGNLRFAAFVEQACPELSLHFHAVDNCELFEHVEVESPVEMQYLDVLESLMADTLEKDLQAPPCAMTACFAFIHHIPTVELRERLLHTLVRRTQPGGLIAVSLWSFLDEPGLAERAAKTTQEAMRELQLHDLDENDCLLGWQNTPGLWRYCHSFSDEEADDLAECVEPEARLIRRFRADGRNGKLNSYLVFQRS